MEQKDNEKLVATIEKQEKIILSSKKTNYCLKERCKFLETELSKFGYSMSNYSSGFHSINAHDQIKENIFQDDQIPNLNDASISVCKYQNNNFCPKNNPWNNNYKRQKTAKMNRAIASNSVLSGMPKKFDECCEISIDTGQVHPRNDNETQISEYTIKSAVIFPKNNNVIHIDNNSITSNENAVQNDTKILPTKSSKPTQKTRYFFGCMSTTAIKDDMDDIPTQTNDTLSHMNLNKSLSKNSTLKASSVDKLKKIKEKNKNKLKENSDETSF
ncbi:hypothetical protein HZS_1114, partial [Henneguya salminicola]